MENNESKIISKYEEKLVRKLGEIAILIHLTRSPEGSHAYEIRSKASEILFEKRHKGLKFLQNHFDILTDLRNLKTKYEFNSSEYKELEESLLKSIEDCPIFKHNLRFRKILEQENSEVSKKDMQFLEEIILAIEETISEMKNITTIWSNISGIYPAIESLEKNSMIEFVKEEKTEEGRLKKIYVITDLGKQTLTRIMASLMDITSFMFESEGEHAFFGKGGFLSARFLPFRKLFHKLTEDLSPEAKKKIIILKGKHSEKHHGRPFVRMMMEQGIAMPRLNVLIRHPEMIEKHLENLESDEERKMVKSYLKSKLEEHKQQLTTIIEGLD